MCIIDRKIFEFLCNPLLTLVIKLFPANHFLMKVKWFIWNHLVWWIFLQVYSIRDAAANNLKRPAEEFGPEWAMQHIIPQVGVVFI